MVKKIGKTHIQFSAVEKTTVTRPIGGLMGFTSDAGTYFDGYRVTPKDYEAILAILSKKS